MKHNVNDRLIEFLIPMSDLRLDPANAREGHDVPGIAASLEEFGQLTLLVVDENRRIEKGNGTFKAARSLGWTHIAALRVGHDPITGARYSIADNRLGDKSHFSLEALGKILGSLDEPETIPGADEKWLEEVKALVESDAGVADVEDVEPRIDRASELRQEWCVELGQTWGFGNHRLFVGPAEKAGIECDFAIFDPPFNWAWQTQENSLSWGLWKTALVMGRENCMPLAVRDDFWHWWVWDAGMNRFGGRGHRPVTGCAMMLLFGEHCWHESEGLAALDRHKIERFDWPTQVVHIQDHLAGREYKHEKPYPLTDYILSLYSQPGDKIGDFFAGSGAFLIACENLKRQCHGAELLPENAAVILDRWTRTFEVEPCLL